MNTVSRAVETTRASRPGREAWGLFWQDAAQSRCIAGDAAIWRGLAAHWSRLARALPSGAQVLDLGCGAGAVARELLAARDDLSIVGVDYARIPLALHPRMTLLADTEMEDLPFPERRFDAVVSQFGFEYGERRATVRELERVMSGGARLSLLVHHAESAVIATNRARLLALNGLLEPGMAAAFRRGDAGAFEAGLARLTTLHPDDALVAELARALPSRLELSERERLAVWKAIDDALAPERCLTRSLLECCVAADGLREWLAPLAGICRLAEVDVLREADGRPIAWRIEGCAARS